MHVAKLFGTILCTDTPDACWPWAYPSTTLQRPPAYVSAAAMASTAASARLQHLHNASLALVVASPATAAYLQSTHLAIADEGNDRERLADNEVVCKACGNILIPGWSCKSLTRNDNKRERPTRSRKESRDVKTVKLECLRCHTTSTALQQKPLKAPSRARKPATHTLQPNIKGPGVNMLPVPAVATGKSLETQAKAPIASTTNRKARGKKSSLQSLLASQKRPAAVATKNSGLDLMDFIKT